MCNKIRQTCVSKVIVFCVTPIVPESFMIVSSTSSTAQGGGGSFKNRKRIGEIDCCE